MKGETRRQYAVIDKNGTWFEDTADCERATKTFEEEVRDRTELVGDFFLVEILDCSYNYEYNFIDEDEYVNGGEEYERRER